jgi:hypothetical protein
MYRFPGYKDIIIPLFFSQEEKGDYILNGSVDCLFLLPLKAPTSGA